jgi:Big-like domain-containing protein
MKRGTAKIVTLLALLAAAPASANFHPVGGSLNVNPDVYAGQSDIAAVGGVPYVALDDNPNQGPNALRVRRLDGTSWDFVGGELVADPAVDHPSITGFEGQPWVAATEFVNDAYQTFVSHFDGSAWQRSEALNLDAAKHAESPDITVVDGPASSGTPFVAFSNWTGSRFEVRVKRHTSTDTWETIGTALNAGTPGGGFYPKIASAPGQGNATGTPYVAWWDQWMPPQGPPISNIHVAAGSIDENASQSFWTTLGDQLSQGDNGPPDIAVVDGVPWVAWPEKIDGVYQVRVARYRSGTWRPVGQFSLNQDATKDANFVHIANVGGTAYVVIGERFDTAAFRDHVWVKRFDGTSWVAVGGPLNLDPALSGFATGIADVGGVPYVAFAQSGATNASPSQLRVSREDAPTCQPATLDVPHNALAQAVSLSCDEGTRRIVSPPSHGVLSDLDGSAGTVKYTPAGGYSGPDSFTFASGDGELESPPATVSLDVARAAATDSPATPDDGQGGDGQTATPRPSLSSLRRSHGFLAVGRGPGTIFSFQLNADAKVTMAIRRTRSGRRVGQRCLAFTPARRTQPRCLRLVTVATLTRDGRKGPDSILFNGRIGTRALPPGSYRAVLYAENAAGRSPGRASGFTIVG